MTRYLSQALGAVEPAFSLSIEQLERAGGQPCADIRLTTELAARARHKIAELGLDPQDTTGPELYQALQERLRRDEIAVREALHVAADAAGDEVAARVRTFAAALDMPRSCFALKPAAAKRLLRARPPKTAMKRLGYRSLESLLKHEQPAFVYAAAAMCETPQWHKLFREQYAKLQPADFETRDMAILSPATQRWRTLSADFTAAAKHNILVFKELGAIVVLPLPAAMDGLAIAMLLLILYNTNDIRAHSSFVKLQQVKPGFGKIMQKAAQAEPEVAHLAGQPVPWRAIQRHYARTAVSGQPTVFEPHVQADDLQWHEPEDVLARILPALTFWRDTQCLCTLHSGQPVSLNVLDVALGVCNRLPFAQRAAHFVRDNLWHELILRYLHHGNLEQALAGQLQQQLSGAD